MVSLLTNQAAMSALQALNATGRALAKTQGQISTGLNVASASDNGAYWSIGSNMKSRIGGISAVQDSLSLTKSIADVTSSALTGIIASTKKMQTDLLTAQTAGVDLAQIQTDIAAQQSTIKQIAGSASFNGVNWLVGSDSFITTVDETENFDTDYATYISILNHVSAPSVKSNATVSRTDVTTKTDTNGNISQVNHDYAGNVRFYNVNYYQPTITETSSGALLPDYVSTPTSFGSSGVTMGRVNTSAMQLFTSSSDTITVHHTMTWTDRSTTDSQPFVFTEIDDKDIGAGGSGIFGRNADLGASLLDLDISTFKLSTLAIASSAVTTALQALTDAATSVGAVQTMVAAQKDFNASLSDALTSGVGSLVDADMDEASTRLQALQSQQQLGVQSLSIANNDSQSILKLFQ